MDFIKQFISLVNGTKLLIMVILVGADFLLGVLLALKKGEFSLQKLSGFLETDVLYQLGGYFVSGFVGVVMPQFADIVLLTSSAFIVSMTASALSKIKELGLPVPKFFVS